jgi:hypothetical protein
MMNEVTLTAVNTTAETQAVSLFQAINNSGTANATTQYSYDLSGQILTDVYVVTLYAKTASQVDFAAYTAPVAQGNLQSIADALTSIGFGSWYVVGETLNCNNDTVIFGDIDPVYIPPP